MREPPQRARGQGRARGPGRAEPAGSADGDSSGDEAALSLLAEGALQVQGRLAVASNETFYCELRREDQSVACVYKPVTGERPLWDFPTGTLAGREVAAYLVSQAGGWNVVPPTVHRDGPFGPGMCQLWIDADPAVDIIALSRRSDHAGLRAMAVFDAVVNNADRKIGHLLPSPDGRLYGCDHGVCFGEEYKLRTVLWQWRGKALPASAITALRQLQTALSASDLAAGLARLISPRELDATAQRVDLLLRHKVHPFPPEDWPAVPWPPV